ncbi:ABC transporter permease [Abyssisolibacter fermentans]|uniref:ABC transporter permease n=1 Tax=Abyssisolibacter fermentans TaxID=1766203 RepID=UPI000832E9C1|nr:ABC transporter permease [Abyssisolibacter fermentans]
MIYKMYELKKSVSYPLIVLICIFIGFNFLLISEKLYVREELDSLNKIIDEVGYKIDDEMLEKLDKYYNDKLKKFNNLNHKKTNKIYKSIDDFFEKNKYQIEEVMDGYTDEEKELLDDLRVIEFYYDLINPLKAQYKNIDIIELGEEQIEMNKLSGQAAETVRTQYRKFNDRFYEIIKNKEHINLFLFGKSNRMHLFLFRDLLKTIMFEVMIIVVLITSYLINYEFNNKTFVLIYTTRKGRNLIKDKLFTALIISVLVTTVIMGITLGVYFIVFDYSRLLNVPINSVFNWELKTPFMSWFKMSYGKFLLCSIGLVYAIELVFVGIAVVLSELIRNNYVVFFVFLILAGICYMLPSIIPGSTKLIFLSVLTPFSLVWGSVFWFMESGALTIIKYYELITLGVWACILIILIKLCIKRFKHQNIY